MEFFEGANLLATVTVPPYTFTLNGVQAGNYSLTARATDNRGLTTSSSAVNITVNSGAAQLFFIYTDQLNTPRVITDQTNKVVWRWDNNDPFGANVPDENPSGLGSFTFNLRFPGQYFDRETSTHYNYFRDYDPAIGRYMEADPIGLAGGINPYSYVAGNTLSRADPRGLAIVCTPAGVCIIVPDPISSQFPGSSANSQSSRTDDIFNPPMPKPQVGFPTISTPSNFPVFDPLDCDRRLAKDLEQCRNTCQSVLSGAACRLKAEFKAFLCRKFRIGSGGDGDHGGTEFFNDLSR